MSVQKFLNRFFQIIAEVSEIFFCNDPKIYHFYNIINGFALIKLHLNSGILLVLLYALIKILELGVCGLLTMKHLNV